MTKIIHCADLHLTSRDDRGYSLSVLDEILSSTDQNKAKFLLICGDLFDSFDDAINLRAEFRSRIKQLSSHCKILFVPGNHDELSRGNGSLTTLDLGVLQVCHKTPFEVLCNSEVDFLCIPHQHDYRHHQEWSVPPKKVPFRIALAHGIVSGINIFTGPESQEGGSVGTIDPDVFNRFNVDYAAMGHIHSRRNEQHGQTWISYPGSSRVWRRGETGSRGVNIITLNRSIQVEFLPLAVAGQFRSYHLPLTPDGRIEHFEKLASSWEGNDWIEIRLSGIVEDENCVAELERNLRLEHAGRVRKIEIERTEVQPLPGIISQPIVTNFLKIWKKRQPDIEDERAYSVWLKAWQMGLEQIKNAMRAK